MKHRLRYKEVIIGAICILLFCVSATAGIRYSSVDEFSFKTAIGNFLLDKQQGPINLGTGQQIKHQTILEPGTMMLFGIGLIGLAFVGKIGYSK